MIVFPRAILALSLIGLATFINAVTYNVIADPFQNMDVVVVVDNIVYPLKPEYGILYKGEAPSPKDGYSYAYIDNNNFTISESFIRPPLDSVESSATTLNEFFNRSNNAYNIETLPQVLPPLDSIHRIQSDLHIQNQIPTIHIYGDQSAIDELHKNQLKDIDVNLNMAYFGLKDVQTFENVEVSLSGYSARWFSKLSYSIKLNKKDDTNLFSYKNIKLRSLVRDHSFVRENICHNVMKSVGIAASEFSYVRLFINNRAIGLYGLIETFQDPWSAAVFADGDTTTYKPGHMYEGYGFKATEGKTDFSAVSDLRYEIDLAHYNSGQYKVKAGPNKKELDSLQGLQEFTKFINESAVGKTSQSDWEKILDVKGFLRAMVLEDLLGQPDGYLQASNNFYLYKDPRQEGRMIYIPADMDTTLGGTLLFNTSMMTTGNYADFPGLFFRPLTKAVLAYPDYLNSYMELHFFFTKNLMNPNIMNPYIDSIIDMIRVDVEWDATLGRVGRRIPPAEALHGKALSDRFDQIKPYLPPGYDLSLRKGSRNSTEATPAVQTLDSAVGSASITQKQLSVKKFIALKSSAILQVNDQK